jgi:hypothetical protein
MQLAITKHQVLAHFLGNIFTVQAAALMHLQDLKYLKKLKKLLWWFRKVNIYICWIKF